MTCVLLGQIHKTIADEKAPRAAPRRVSFRAWDDVEIVADYVSPRSDARPAPAVVLVHMYRTDRSAWEPLLAPLHEAGFATLAIDLRGCGESGAPRQEELRQLVQTQNPGVFREMYRDVGAAISWLAALDEVDKTRVAIVGADVGCSVALDYAAKDKSVDTVVCLTPGRGYMGMDTVSSLMVYGARPSLMLAVESDRRTLDVLSAINSDVLTKVVGRGTGQGTRMLKMVDGVDRTIVGFLREHTGDAVDGEPVVAEWDRAEFFPSVEALRRSNPKADRSRLRWYSSRKEAEERGLKSAAE